MNAAPVSSGHQSSRLWRAKQRRSSMNHPFLLRPQTLLPSPQILIARHVTTKGAPRSPSVTMRDRSKNRKPSQRGRYLSIEGIQAVQALKRASKLGGDSLDRALEAKVQRLVKFDMMAVLRELLQQGEALLALQVFEEVRKEYWYKPQLSVYIDMITVLASNGLQEKVERVCSCLKMECLDADTEGFNSLLKTLLEFGYTRTAMDCFRLMKMWDSEPDESTFRILVKGLESNGKGILARAMLEEAENLLGGPLEFPDEREEAILAGGGF